MESDSVSGLGSMEFTEVGNINNDVIDVTPVAKQKKQSKFMELLSDVMCSTESSSGDQTIEDKVKIELLLR